MSQDQVNERVAKIFEDSIEAGVIPSSNLVLAAITIAKFEAGEE